MNYSSLIQIIEDGWLPFPDSVIPPFRKSVIWEKLPESIAKEQYEESKFDYEIESAVRDSVKVDEKPALWLSGGIDSCTLLYYLVERLGVKPKCYTINFDYFTKDIEYSKLLTKKYGVPHKIINMDLKDHLDLLRETTLNLRCPNDFWTSIPFIQKIIEKDGCEYSISALGMDELMAGYPDHVNTLPINFSKIEAEILKRCDSYYAWNQVNSYKFPVKFPYLSPKLVSYCRSIERDQKTNGHETKLALRNLMKSRLPEEIVEVGRKVATKGGFTPSIRKWWKEGLEEWTTSEIKKLPFKLRFLTRNFIRKSYWFKLRLANTRTFLELLNEGAYEESIL